jgi:hypothetical protein
MKVRSRLRTLASKTLSESIDVKTMVHVSRRLLGNYDLYERTGFPTSVPIPNQTAARQIVEDIVNNDLFLQFVILLIDIQRLGMGGHKHKFARLNSILNELGDLGYRYDEDAHAFVEDTSVRTTRNWGVLREGESYVMAFLGVDVAGNSALVKRYGSARMSEIYRYVRETVGRCAEHHNGRLWGWEGDGGVAAFTFEEQNLRATLAGMQIVNELFIYNLSQRVVDGGLHLRLMVHNGPCRYAEDGSELKSDTVKRLWDLDGRYGVSDTLIVTDSVAPSLERTLMQRFEPLQAAHDQLYYTYSVRWGA